MRDAPPKKIPPLGPTDSGSSGGLSDSHSGFRYGKAFSPSHITGFFQIFPNGSTGAGLNTTDGAVTEVWLVPASEPDLHIELNGVRSDAPVSRRVCEAFAPLLARHTVRVRHRIAFPIGYGLGMSGAGAFSLALALNQALDRPHSYDRCMNIAREAEIASGTGLGDVVAQQFSGLMIGKKPYPSVAVDEIPTGPLSVVCAFFEPIETAAIIRNSEWKARINAIGAECMERIEQTPTRECFTALAREFTFRTGLLNDQLRGVLEAVPDASMAMLGQTAFVITDDIGSAVRGFSTFTNRLFVSTLSSTGASEVRDRSTINAESIPA